MSPVSSSRRSRVRLIGSPSKLTRGAAPAPPGRPHRGVDHGTMPEMHAVKHPDGQMERPRGQGTRRLKAGELDGPAHRTKLGTASRAGISRCSISGSVSD